VDNWTKLFLIAGFGQQTAQYYADIFAENDIQLDMLSELTHEVLHQMGIRKAGDRIRILRLQRLVSPKGHSTLNNKILLLFSNQYSLIPCN